MKYSVLATILPLLAAAAPEEYSSDFEKRSPNPQLQALIPLAVGGLALGAIGSAVGGSLRNDNCACGRQTLAAPCAGSLCECQNTANIGCWAKEQGKCKINLKVCPSGNGQAGSPTSLNSEYPPCGQGLPTCAGGKVCQKLDQSCRDGRTGGCIGLCIPNFSPQSKQPWWSEPKGYNQPKAANPAPQQPANNGGSNGWKWAGAGNQPKGGQTPVQAPKCPASYACQPGQVCVVDPHDTLAAMRGPSFKCVTGNGQGICGGFDNRQCAVGQLCVPDPRIQCVGAGCTGLCA